MSKNGLEVPSLDVKSTLVQLLSLMVVAGVGGVTLIGIDQR